MIGLPLGLWFFHHAHWSLWTWLPDGRSPRGHLGFSVLFHYCCVGGRCSALSDDGRHCPSMQAVIDRLPLRISALTVIEGNRFSSTGVTLRPIFLTFGRATPHPWFIGTVCALCPWSRSQIRKEQEGSRLYFTSLLHVFVLLIHSGLPFPSSWRPFKFYIHFHHSTCSWVFITWSVLLGVWILCAHFNLRPCAVSYYLHVHVYWLL